MHGYWYGPNLTVVFFVFFFFVFEKPLIVAKFYLILGKSKDTKHKISDGTSSIQTNTGKENLALWAKAWTTELTYLLTKEVGQFFERSGSLSEGTSDFTLILCG